MSVPDESELSILLHPVDRHLLNWLTDHHIPRVADSSPCSPHEHLKHRTLDAAVRWSYELLDETQRRQEIGIRLAGRVEKLAEAGLVEIGRRDAGGHRTSRGVDDFGAAAVVQRDVEPHAGVGRGAPHARRKLVLHVGRQLLLPADDLEPDVVAQQRLELEAEVGPLPTDTPPTLVTISQAGLACSISVTPGTTAFDANAGSSSAAVTAPAGCSWSASSAAPAVSRPVPAASAVSSVAPNPSEASQAGNQPA
jgi:hypothetical protein